MDNFNVDIKTLDIETAEKMLPEWELKYQRDSTEIQNLDIILKEKKEQLDSLEVRKLNLQNTLKINKEIIEVLNNREKDVLQTLQKANVTYPIYKARAEQYQNDLENKILQLKQSGKEPSNIDYSATIKKLKEEKQMIMLNIEKNTQYINNFIKKHG
ncbi:hypothetical protein GWI33_023233 [Rhynchophorus ferrugineus]|uniref:Uncharacterized protein n=1 Tax=Rhynchophorus ferrugineus TaxID=354439 RepID=A0A834M1T0_RHYFE|nr:hypothetical protein GWI33_023233 [Rhynchophorus ferrugineus]